ncbi:MAG: PAS domain-containing protein [Chromatocurvus sp.]
MISAQGVDLLFEQHPDAMWVYDTETLAFLAVNEAVIRHYGYSRDEFLEMTIKTIRPPEDVARLREVVRGRGRGPRRPGL